MTDQAQEQPGEPAGPPERIGAYKVLRTLGRGAMGVVYEALNEQIDKRVAIKVLSSHHAVSKDMLVRFQNEARATSRVNHPGIVNIFEFNRMPDGTAYLVMEYLAGETMALRIQRRRKRPLPEALRWGHQMASVLIATHAQGIVHRDLKPGNVMLVPDPEHPGQERVKVLDFGIAKLARPDAEVEGTQSDVIMGTPAYMAPEQCRGASTVTAQADVYSLGVMLYEMLSGDRPLVGATPVETMYRQLHEKPDPLEKHRPDLPRPVLELVDGMLDKEPGRRPAMTGVATVLGEHAGVAARPRAGRSPMQLVLVLVLAVAVWQWRRPGAVPPPPVAPAPVAATPAPAAPAPAPAPAAPARAAPAPAEARVRWSLTTEPSGAQVILGGEVAGVTPWQQDRPAAPGAVEVILRRRGYQDRALRLPGSESATRREVLRPRKARGADEGEPVIDIMPLDRSALPRRP